MSSLIQTDQILLQLPTEREKKYILYLPCNLRLKIINIQELSTENLTAKMQVHLKFDIDITDLDDYFVNLIKKNLNLAFSHED